jgi:hypothetical protein
LAVVRFIAVAVTVRVFALPAVLFDVRVVAGLVFVAFDLAFDDAALVVLFDVAVFDVGRPFRGASVFAFAALASFSADPPVS